MSILADIKGIHYKSCLVKVGEHIEKDNWTYIIYQRRKKKWVKIRAIQHFISKEAAIQAARIYVDNLENKL